MSSVDVIVPCYNYGRYLGECVDSVLTQSHENLRVLIIDDASTDDTPTVCAELAARDSRVEIHRHPVNRGHIATYNEGIRLARSDYMLLLSADDFLLPGALARAVAVLDADPEVGLAHGGWFMYSAGDRLPKPVENAAGAKFPDTSALVEALAGRNHIGTATAVVRTSVQKKLGGYRLELPHAGDLEMWLRFALHSKVAHIPELQAAYRRHEANMSRAYDRVADLRQCLDAFELNYRDIRARLRDSALVEMGIRRAFAKRALRCAGYVIRRGGTIAPLPWLLRLWLREKMSARLLKLRRQFGLRQPS